MKTELWSVSNLLNITIHDRHYTISSVLLENCDKNILTFTYASTQERTSD